MTNLEGQTFAGYEIVAKLGEGGMGSVWKARQPLLNRFVALKVMGAQLSTNQEFIVRFIREAASAAALNHPNIVQVYTAGETEGTYYFVMEFVEGESLKKRLDHAGRIEPGEAIALTLHIAQALQYAWNEAKLIHRDIKPDNIFLSVKGVVKVGDLGLAKSVGAGSTEMTATGMMMGSPHYISPEQARALKDMDFRADIYSLGCTLYHMVSGRTAYTADDSLALVLKHVTEPPPDIRVVMPDCPPQLVALIGKMMAKDRNERHASYEGLIADLWQVHDGLRQPQPVVASAPVVTATPTPAKPVPATDPNAATMAAPTEMLGQPSAAPAPPAAADPTTPRAKVVSQPTVIPSRKSPAMLYVVAGVAAVALLGGLLWWAPWRSGSAVAGWQNAVNLLKLVELPRDAVKGDWKQRDGMVVATADHNNAQLAFPYHPPAEYDYRVKFLCLQGEGIVQTLVRDGHQFSWMMGVPGGDVAGFENISGAGIGESPARITRKPMVTTGNEHISLVEVRNDGVRGYLDGELLAQWKTDYRDMSVQGAWRLPPDRPIAVGTYKSSVQIHAAEVREVTGKGTFARTPLATRLTSPAIQHTASVFTNSVGGEMVAIPPGEFMMGSTKKEQEWAVANNAAEHRVKSEGDQPRKVIVKQGFWMGRTEVTVGQWKQFVKGTGYVTDGEKNGESLVVQRPGNLMANVKGTNWKNPNFDFKLEDDHPVCCVSWNDALVFCRWLTERERRAGRLPEGRVVRLPTEAEWEYACRAGSQDKCWWGDSLDDGKGRLNWDGKEDGFEYIAPVDSYGARGRNRFGLADMLGNVFEWCLDGYDPVQAREDYWNGNANARVLRGGAFDMRHNTCRCARRHSGSPSSSGCTRGFRVVVAATVVCSKSAAPASQPNTSQNANDTFSQSAINLLPLIDPQKDEVQGVWTITGGELHVAGSNYARLQIPYQPPDEYDFRISFTRRQGNDAIWQFLTGGGHAFFYCLSGWRGTWAGFGLIRDQQVCDGPSSVRMKNIENGRSYTSLMQVRKNGVKGFLDDRLVTEWKTNYQDMSLQGTMRMHDERSLGVGANQSAVVFHRIEVREVTGKGTFTRGAPSVPTNTPVSQSSIAPKLLGNVFTNSVGAEMVAIPPGRFLLGSTKEEREWSVMPGNMGSRSSALKRVSLEGEQQPRPAVIRSGFWMGRTEVTVGQWRKFVDATGGYPTTAEINGVAMAHGGGGPGLGQIRGASWRKLGFSSPVQDDHPVACVSWEDASAFCRWMTEREQAAGRLPPGCVMRLPTEAEWEYACRGGKQSTRFWWGDTKEDGKDRLNWSKTSDADDALTVVDRFGERGRNGFGLADMAGNVWEWCLDNLDPAGAHAELYADNSSMRVLKGGAFDCMPLATRCASREGRPAETADFRYGFRVCCGVDVPGGDAFVKEVAALPAEQQVARVMAELKRLNPDSDGREMHKIQDGKVIELEIWTDHVTNITPIRALTSLQNLYCTGPTDEKKKPTGKKGKLADLSPLKGMKLIKFKCRYNPISDFSPLASMAITFFESEHNEPVCDLSPLEHMPLTWLKFDQSLLQQGRNCEILRGIKTLEKINTLSAAEFWKRVDTGKTPKP